MKLILMKCIIMNSSMLIKLNNPLSISVALIMKTLMISILMNLMSQNSWLSMMFFLMMVGGLLIMFSYMTSIVSNEKFKFNINLTIILMMLLIPMESNLFLILTNENQEMLTSNSMMELMLMKMYNKKSLFMLIFMVIYLLITMIMVSKLIMKNLGPLRSKN
uniref:NADH dehydrogenase subunit 6 n=1 Tax=Batracomorphus lateprocessus TaxID=1962545 RepID=A0A6C0NA13_9HEMI|nr:NADH dehydrogenase subunit 6 [Batracomorphus lateprocessus]QHW07518.1 NADH dehydrogenase subunit 6 [Batracomorphus lateprocessus]